MGRERERNVNKMSDQQSRLAAIRQKFQNNSSSYIPTPESQFGKIKKSKREQMKAVKIAKARAARYNMTLRSLAIKTNQNVSKMQRTDIKKKKETAERASKYNMTSRALSINSVNKKDQQNIAKALDPNVSPTVAKDVLSAVAHKRHEEDVQATTALVRPNKPSKNKRSLAPPPKKSSLVAKKEEAAGSEKKEEEKAKRIEMQGVGAALAAGDENALNKAILLNFLQTNAPKMTGQVDVMLEEYKEQLEVLFDKILNKFPDAADAEVNGRLKAEKEIAEAVENKDVDLASKEAPKVEEAPVEEDDADDEEDSMIMSPDNIDKLEDDPPAEAGKVVANAVNETVDVEDDDDDSLIVDADAAFKDEYEATIKAAEVNPIEIAVKSLANRKSTVRLDNELKTALNTTYNEKKSLVSVAESIDSLVQADAPSMLEGGYIVSAELEEAEQKEEPSRWAVQFQNKNFALKQKLLKQGLSKQQVEDLVDNLDSNTSEML